MIRLAGNPDKKLPAILFLHGLGESGDDPSAVLREGLPPFVAERPEFPFIVIAPQCPWNTWWPELADWLDQLLLHCGTSLPIDYQRLYLTRVERLKDTPVWASHGAKDDVVPLVESQRLVDALRECGGKVESTVYPDAAHDSWTETYNNPQLYSWLLSHRVGG